jgi:hypothetical protein
MTKQDGYLHQYGVHLVFPKWSPCKNPCISVYKLLLENYTTVQEVVLKKDNVALSNSINVEGHQQGALCEIKILATAFSHAD